MLTHIKITTAKPSEKLYKLPDTLGLYLAVKPNGSKPRRHTLRSVPHSFLLRHRPRRNRHLLALISEP